LKLTVKVGGPKIEITIFAAINLQQNTFNDLFVIVLKIFFESERLAFVNSQPSLQIQSTKQR